MITKEDFIKIVNKISPEVGVLVLGRSHVANMQYFLSLGMDQTS